ncbi:hypothetical protein TNCV_2511081 [Trichonephila clavipes]|nr:hypothetical protein TNCV_2511081 [Trichonephila clavipes]
MSDYGDIIWAYGSRSEPPSISEKYMRNDCGLYPASIYLVLMSELTGAFACILVMTYVLVPLVLVKTVTTKCLGGPPVDHDRLNAHPGYIACVVSNTRVVVVSNATCLTKSDRGPRNSSWQEVRLSLSLSTIQVTVRFSSAKFPEGTIDGNTTYLHLHNFCMELKGREIFFSPCARDSAHKTSDSLI